MTKCCCKNHPVGNKIVDLCHDPCNLPYIHQQLLENNSIIYPYFEQNCIGVIGLV